MRRAWWVVPVLLLALVTASGHVPPRPTPLPPRATGPWLFPRSVAENLALGMSILLAPTASALMPEYVAARRYTGELAYGYDSHWLVWVVTVHARVETDGITAAAFHTFYAYSVVMDAGTGRLIEECTGCAWLSRSA